MGEPKLYDIKKIHISQGNVFLIRPLISKSLQRQLNYSLNNYYDICLNSKKNNSLLQNYELQKHL